MCCYIQGNTGFGSDLNMCPYNRMKHYEEQAKSINSNGNIFAHLNQSGKMSTYCGEEEFYMLG
jgi:hypothetical protein